MEGYRVVVRKPASIDVEAFEVLPPGRDEVLIKSRVSLISPGTERAFFLALPNTNATYPLYPGYSHIGEVIQVGQDVTHLCVDQRVASAAHHMSHAVVVADACLPVADGLADHEAVFFNLAAIAMQDVRKARVELGEPVIVLGAGLIGLLAVQLARLSGGLPVIAIDTDEKRLSLARTVGADEIVASDEATVSRVHDITGGEGAAVVIEATGVPSVVLTAFQLAAARGRVVLVGSPRGETNGVDFYGDVHRKGLSIIGGHETTRPRWENSPGWWTQRAETLGKRLSTHPTPCQPSFCVARFP